MTPPRMPPTAAPMMPPFTLFLLVLPTVRVPEDAERRRVVVLDAVRGALEVRAGLVVTGVGVVSALARSAAVSVSSGDFCCCAASDRSLFSALSLRAVSFRLQAPR